MDDECGQFRRDAPESAHQMVAGETTRILANRGQLPLKEVLTREDDTALIHKARERLAAPQRVKVSMDDL
jgi:hypothetical protein